MGNITDETPTYWSEPYSTLFLIFNSFLLSLTFFFGTSGNLLVFCAIFRSRGLRTSNNALLLNLSAVALFRCCLDSPVFLLSLIVGDSVGHLLCCIQQFTFSLCSCVQFLTLVLMSVERFLAEEDRENMDMDFVHLGLWAFHRSSVSGYVR